MEEHVIKILELCIELLEKKRLSNRDKGIVISVLKRVIYNGKRE